MKKFLIALFVLVFLISISCKEKSDPAKDKEAVLKVLQEEGDAFAANDLNRLAAIHIQDSTATRLAQDYDTLIIFKGWNEIRTLLEDYIKGNSTDSSWKNPKNLKGNIIIKVVGNSAWVLCDNTWKYEFNNVPVEWTNTQIAIFEKTDGKWKFSFNAFIPKPEVKAKAEVSK